jgi:hypothetical protein
MNGEPPPPHSSIKRAPKPHTTHTHTHSLLTYAHRWVDSPRF